MISRARAARAATFSARDAALLRQVREAVREVEPEAQLILFGSRARGDAEAESDWDMLVLLDGEVDRRRKNAIRERLYTLSLALPDCPALSAIVHSRAEWESPLFRAMPFHERVEAEGVPL